MFDVKIEGSRQGSFFRVTGLGFHYQVGVPSSTNGTQATGIHQHGQVVITKFWDAATPQLFQALVSGEILNRVELSFMRGGNAYQRMILENARVANLEQYMHFNAVGHTIGDDPRQLEDVSFVFGQIMIENLEGKIQAGDVVA